MVTTCVAIVWLLFNQENRLLINMIVSGRCDKYYGAGISYFSVYSGINFTQISCTSHVNKCTILWYINERPFFFVSQHFHVIENGHCTWRITLKNDKER